jgi:photosystem II stability/assembly factor-like uncharacterized protein
MNEERFEVDLRAVFDEMAPADVPAQLRAIVAAVSRQRVARRSARKGPAVRVLLVAAIIVAGGALVVSAGGLYNTAPPSPSGEPSGAVASSSPSATQTAAPSSSPSAAPTATPVASVDESTADRAGTFVGGLWAIRGSTLFISTDAGATWHTGTIPMASGALGTAAFVLDPEHAWSVTPGPDSTPFDGSPTDVLSLVVHRTTDGGKTWQQSMAPGNYPGTIQRLVFVDALHGYLMCSAIRQSSGLSTVLRTDDGGRTWSVAGSGAWLGSMFAASDAHTVWAGAEQEAGPVIHPVLDVSRDGGRTWETAALPGLVGPSNQGGVMHYLTEPPLFLDANNGIVAIAANNPAPVGTVTTFYRTTDGGRTWSKAGDLGADVSYGPAVLDARDWLVPVQNSTSLEATSDAGTTWHTVITSGLPVDSQVTWIGGLDATHAAALVAGPSGLELLITADAARSWKPAVLDLTPASTTGP